MNKNVDLACLKQAETGPSRRHIQGSKIAKRLPSVKYSFTVLENRKFYEKIFSKNYILKKMDRVARRCPLARAPGALKGGHFRNCQHFCRSWRGFVAKHQKIEGGKIFIFGKKSHSAEKNWKGGPFEVFQHPFCRKTWKNWRKKNFFIFGIKSHNAEKNWKEEPFGIFQHPFCRKTSKKMQGDPLRKKKFEKKSEKKCLAVPKKIERGDALVSPGMICYAEKQVKPFWFSSLGQMVLFDTFL